MSEEAKQEASESCKGEKTCCCTSKHLLLGVGAVILLAGVVWLALACPSCH